MFALEREMTPIVEAWLQARSDVVRREFSPAWGGAVDLVGCRFHQDAVEARRRLGQQQIIHRLDRVQILLAISSSEASPTSLSRLTEQFPRQYMRHPITRELGWLIKRRLVREVDGGFCRVTPWLPLHERVVAVELKLNRIDEVYHQARNNHAFATDSWAALPADVATRLVCGGRRVGFAQFGIGVLGVDAEGCYELRAARHRTDDMLDPCVVDAAERLYRAWRTTKPDATFVPGKVVQNGWAYTRGGW